MEDDKDVKLTRILVKLMTIGNNYSIEDALAEINSIFYLIKWASPRKIKKKIHIGNINKSIRVNDFNKRGNFER